MTRNMSGVHDFDFLHGNWRVRHHTLRVRLEGCREWDLADAVDRVRLSFCGLGNYGCFRRLINDRPFEGMPIRLYDPEIARWRIYWLDSVNQRLEPPLVGGFSGGEGFFIGDDQLGDKAIKVRFIWSAITPVSARWEQAFSADGGDSWELNSIMEFSRDNSLCDKPRLALNK